MARDCLRHNLPACMWQTPGFFRFRDGGQTWQQVDTHPFWGDAGVLRLRVHPQDAARVYAATAAGLYLSTDGGDTWEQITSLTRYLQRSGIDPANPLQQGLIFEVLLDPFDPNILYVGVQRHGVLRSEDGGQTWEDASAGLADPNETVRALVADPQSSGLAICRHRKFGRLPLAGWRPHLATDA